MNKLIEFAIVSVLALVFTVIMGFMVYRRVKAIALPLRYDRKLYIGGIYFVSFLIIEAISGIYIYGLPWYYYIFVVLFAFAAVFAITLITRRIYKRDHPNEPTNAKRTTFREAYRAANSNTDPVSMIFALAFFLVAIASWVFHQPLFFSLAIPLLIGPVAIYKGIKALHEAQKEHQSNSIHWYTQYRILFGISAILSFPNALILNNGPLAFVRTVPYNDQIETGYLVLYCVPLLASIFFFLRRQYLKKHHTVSSKQPIK